MIAIARIALGAAMVEDPSKRDLTDYEMQSITGEGDTWVSAQAACLIPDGALVLHWRQG